MSRHFIIDTDVASDDAVALVMAMRYPDVQIEAITVVAGNVPVDQAVQNALYTVELCGRSIPVHQGMPGKGRGNITPVGEYNFWADPEAAKIVFESGMRIKMVGWDISRKYAAFNPEDTAKLRAIGTPLSAFCVDIQATLVKFAMNQSGLPGFDLPDPMAMAIALDPKVATKTRSLYFTIEAQSELCRGQSVVDHYNVLDQEPNAEVVLKASRGLFVSMLRDSLQEI